MHSMQIVLSILLWVFPNQPGVAKQDDETNPPTTEEIQLVVTQAERAFQQYKDSLELEAQLPSAKANPDSSVGDRQTFEAAKELVGRLKSNPDSFHGPLGLLLLTTLDDASRNAALCSNSANTDIIVKMAQGKPMSDPQISAMSDTVKSCAYVSAQLYTVSENVHALVLREMDSLLGMNRKAMETVEKCAERIKAMKK
jgi:hypothetical protein